MCLLVRCLQVTAAIDVLLVVGALPALEAAEFETVILKDGQRVTGEVVAEQANRALRRPRLRHPADSAGPDPPPGQDRRVRRRARRRRPGRSSWTRPGFYTTGVLKPSPVKELVSKYGEAVISIETPSGKGSGFIINKDGYAITNAHVIQGETPGLGDSVHERAGRASPGAGSRTSRSSP